MSLAQQAGGQIHAATEANALQRCKAQSGTFRSLLQPEPHLTGTSGMLLPTVQPEPHLMGRARTKAKCFAMHKPCIACCKAQPAFCPSPPAL